MSDDYEDQHTMYWKGRAEALMDVVVLMTTPPDPAVDQAALNEAYLMSFTEKKEEWPVEAGGLDLTGHRPEKKSSPFLDGTE